MMRTARDDAVSDVTAAGGADTRVPAIVMVGADGTVTAFNLAAELLLDRKASDVVGRGVAALEAGNSRSGLALAIVRVLASEDTARYETPWRREGSAELLVEFALLALRWQPTRTLGQAAVVRDVTKRHDAAPELVRPPSEREREQLKLASDRERIGRELDPVVERLFGIGLLLQDVASRVEPPAAAQRISDAVHELGTAIAETRTMISRLRDPPCRLAGARAMAPLR